MNLYRLQSLCWCAAALPVSAGGAGRAGKDADGKDVMGDKPIAGIVAAVAIVPVCAVCILGPAVVGSVIGSAFGWIGDINPFPVAALATIGAAIGVVWTKKRRQISGGGDRVLGGLRAADAEPFNPGSGASPIGPARRGRSRKAS